MFCVMCGKEFLGAKNARYCGECRAKKKKETYAKMNTYTKARNKRLGLTSINIYKEDRDILKNLGAEKETSIAEIVKKLLRK